MHIETCVDVGMVVPKGRVCIIGGVGKIYFL